MGVGTFCNGLPSTQLQPVTALASTLRGSSLRTSCCLGGNLQQLPASTGLSFLLHQRLLAGSLFGLGLVSGFLCSNLFYRTFSASCVAVSFLGSSFFGFSLFGNGFPSSKFLDSSSFGRGSPIGCGLSSSNRGGISLGGWGFWQRFPCCRSKASEQLVPPPVNTQ